jgi:demethylmenaquinone methyltransferase / 2-methoxy-6-polyprenyl-1,4-benzoquinol methylase
MTVLPYKTDEASKKQQVENMFDNISPKYDFLNHFLSLGIDILWRKKAISLLKAHNPKNILDVATGTGDFAIEALKLNPEKITGIDISEGMLEIGRKKILKKNLQSKIILMKGDSENLPFPSESFDAVTVSFGVRNFENLAKGLENIFRVLKPGGVLIVLEFSKPKKFPVKQFYNFYFKFILPKLGRIISRDSSAYTYLPESVKMFPEGPEFMKYLNKAGFKNIICRKLSFGISSIYKAVK